MCARGDGKPDQESTVRLVRRQDVLPLLMAESDATVAVGIGLHFVRGLAVPGLEEHFSGAGRGSNRIFSYC